MATNAGAVLSFALEGTSFTSEEEEVFSKLQPAGLTYFKRNIPEPFSQTLLLSQKTTNVLATSGLPPIVSIDQEGGRVTRIAAPFPNEGPSLNICDGRSDEEALKFLEDYGYQVGSALLKLGINVNFAPVVDVLTEPSNHAIGDRVFGTDIDPVCVRAGAYLEGLQNSGVAGCLKHFPGQGDAKVDTHVGQAIVDLPEKLLQDRELVPFRALLSKSPMVMVSHCVYPVWDTVEASRSGRIIGGILRGEMGYRGLVVSDDMTMGAIPEDEQQWQEAIVESLMAGADLLLICRHIDRCRLSFEAIDRASRKSKAVEERLGQAVSSVNAFRRTLEPKPKH